MVLHRFGVFAVVVAACSVALASPPPPPDAEAIKAIRGPIVDQLLREFDGWLEQPAEYEAKALRESRNFPEGTLYPFVVPAYGYINLAIARPEAAQRHLSQAAKLIDFAIPIVAERLRVDDLAKLDGYREQGTYLTYLTLALCGYRVAGGDDRYDALRKHLCEVLAAAIREREGRPFKSYPIALWSLDTTAAVQCLAIEGTLGKTARYEPIIRQHLDWLRRDGSDGLLGLPYARHDSDGRKPIDKPRGCDLSWRIVMIADIDGDYAAKLYDRYTASYWLERPPIRGFAEWPRGEAGPAGVDSGPILNGIGATASAFGVALVRAMGDREREHALLSQFRLMQTLRGMAVETHAVTGKQTVGGYAPFDAAYVSGFLYGDCVLLWALTYEPWTPR